VLVPVGTHVEPACEAGLTELERRGYPVWRIRGYSAIDQGRNQMATDALAQGFAETMWIDSDIGFHPDDVDRLRQLELPLVCGVYPKKGKREIAAHVIPGTTAIVFGKGGGLTELLYAGTGFLHVRREVYESIQRHLDLPTCNLHFGKAMIPFFQPLVVGSDDAASHMPPSPWYLAEDYAFCERARQSGFKIMADTRVRLSHIGSYAYSWEESGGDPRRYATYTLHLSGEKRGDEARPD
jgi:hypothetical protein